MILFISGYPDSSNEREGMMQRIAAMDCTFAEAERIYLLLSWKRHFLPGMRQVAPRAKFYQLNLFLYFWFVLYLACRSSMLYVHSLYFANRVLPLYFLFPIVTDMHGLVPEELEMEGDGRSRYYGWLESVVVRRSRALVTVTNAMARYLERKHQVDARKVFTVPIFEPMPPVEKKLCTADKYTVIYTGGAQKWQNVDLMIEAAKRKHDEFSMIFLTGDLDLFRNKLRAAGIEERVELGSVPKHEIHSWYQRAHFGFVLRDDVAVNNVACPTKLVEYLASGVVPIVIQPHIGDFMELGYSYILLSDFLNGNVPTTDRWMEMVTNNLAVMQRHREVVSRETANLRRFVVGRDAEA